MLYLHIKPNTDMNRYWLGSMLKRTMSGFTYSWNTTMNCGVILNLS